MRKLTAVLVSAMFIIGSVIPAGAEESRQTTISVSIDPAYTVVIPASTTIDNGATESSIGEVALENAKLEPDKSIYVSVDASGSLKNSRNSSKTIPYRIMNNDQQFKSANYYASGDKTPLVISIDKNDWNKAYAGSYSDVLVFTISYQ